MIDAWKRQTAIRADEWFRAYWDIRSWLARAEGFGYVGAGLSQALFDGPAAFDRTLKGLSDTAIMFDPPFSYPSDFTAEGRRLSALAHDAICADEPKSNVYQAAICVMSDWGWNGNHMHDRLLFRGERNAEWSVRRFDSSIHRGAPDPSEFARRRRKLDIAAYWFRKKFPNRNDSDLEVLAILQHYIQSTWLLDLTTSPYVALFFASRGDGGRGVVYAYSLDEFDYFHRVDPELVGPVLQVKPRFVPRIDRQYGAFVDGGLGWTTRAVVLHELSFRQSPDFRFEDAGLGVTERRLLANEGDWRWFDDLPSQFASVEHVPETGENDDALSRLFIDTARDLRQDAENAPKLVLRECEQSTWPPPVDRLINFAERYLARRSEINEKRRSIAARAIAQFHHLLCDDPDCGYFIRSFNAFVAAIDSLTHKLASDSPVCVRLLFYDCYRNRVGFDDSLAVFSRGLDRLVSTFAFTEI